MNNAKIWQRMTVKQIREGLKDTKTVLIPIGCTEQHGYHLSTDTDNHTAWQVCVRAAEQTGSFVAPLLPYTFSGGELPGTININLNVVSMMITEILRSFAFHGLENLIITLGHGGSENLEAVALGASHFVRDHACYADRKVAVHNFAELCDGFIDMYTRKKDYHAGEFETALMLYWAPDDVYLDEMTTDRADILNMMRDDPDAYQVFSRPVDHPAIVRRVGQNPEIEVGVMGDPSLATVELGESLAKEAVDSLVELIRAMEAG